MILLFLKGFSPFYFIVLAFCLSYNTSNKDRCREFGEQSDKMRVVFPIVRL